MPFACKSISPGWSIPVHQADWFGNKRFIRISPGNAAFVSTPPETDRPSPRGPFGTWTTKQHSGEKKQRGHIFNSARIQIQILNDEGNKQQPRTQIPVMLANSTSIFWCMRILFDLKSINQHLLKQHKAATHALIYPLVIKYIWNNFAFSNSSLNSWQDNVYDL